MVSLDQVIEQLVLLSLDCSERLLVFVDELIGVVDEKLINFDLEISVGVVVSVK